MWWNKKQEPTKLDIVKRKVWGKIIKYIDKDDTDNANRQIDLFYKLDKLEYKR